ncbi:2061_t:CDS:2, partial [Gigaspora margarita]
MSDAERCGTSYNDGSTTSNLINYLAREHMREDEQILFNVGNNITAKCTNLDSELV